MIGFHCYLEEVRNGTYVKERKDPDKNECVPVFVFLCVFVLKAGEKWGKLETLNFQKSLRLLIAGIMN